MIRVLYEHFLFILEASLSIYPTPLSLLSFLSKLSAVHSPLSILDLFSGKFSLFNL